MSQTSSPGVVIHIPHTSTVIPPEYRNQFVLSDEDIAAELVRMTDAYTDELFALAPEAATTVKFPVSRLVLDPERFEDDQQESMASRGMGVIYQRSSLCGPLRREISGDEREALLARFYRPHHQALTEAVQKSLDSHDKCLIIDAHSFSSKPWPYEPDQTSTRPEICLGTDDFHSPKDLTNIAVDAFKSQGFGVDLNRPFAGSLVPMRYYQTNWKVWSIMVEVRRDLYMDERTGLKNSSFQVTLDRIQKAMLHLLAHTR
jgi:N-formylglutamate amidohydrolase